MKQNYSIIETKTKIEDGQCKKENDCYIEILKQIIKLRREGIILKKEIRELEMGKFGRDQYAKKVGEYRKNVSELEDLYFAIVDLSISKYREAENTRILLEKYEGKEDQLTFI